MRKWTGSSPFIGGGFTVSFDLFGGSQEFAALRVGSYAVDGSIELARFGVRCKQLRVE